MLKKKKSSIPVDEFKLASTEVANCGMGLDFKNGQLILPNYNPVSGDVDGFYSIYIVDGNITVNPVATAKSAIQAYCSNSAISATSVTISGCTGGSLAPLATRQLTATVLPSGAIQTGAWTSSAPAKATVNSSGLVTAVAAGTSTITFTSADGGFTATCLITVEED